MPYKDKRGRWHNDDGSFMKGGAAAAKAAGLSANVSGGPGDDKITVNQNVGGKRGRSHGGGGGGGGCVLGTETLTRVKVEDGWDVIAGLLFGLANRRGAESQNLYSLAAQLYAKAHPSPEAAARKDSKQFQYGEQLADLVGLVALHEGWSEASWAAACPWELSQAGAMQASEGSYLQSDDWQDEVAGGVASSVLNDVGNVVGGVIGGAIGGPGGAAVGAELGGMGGTIIGRQIGVGTSNYMQGENPAIRQRGENRADFRTRQQMLDLALQGEAIDAP